MTFSPAAERSADECTPLLKTTTQHQPVNQALSPLAAHGASPMIPIHLKAVNSRNYILVVDDDFGGREVLASVLRRAGYRVDCARDGEAGWEALCADTFDLVITDHDMPRLTGLNLLRRLRIGPLNLPVILISGEMPWGEADLLEMLQLGMAMEKPFSFFQLLANVRSILTRTTRKEPILAEQTLREYPYDQSSPRITPSADDLQIIAPVDTFVRTS